jgi:predicted  nucleic acid-binding Zn-ribbon protein
MEDLTGEEMKKKCTKCGEVKSLTDYFTSKKGREGFRSECKACSVIRMFKYANTERGYLNKKYRDMIKKDSEKRQQKQRHLTFNELFAAWEKHKSIYGMRSAWGPGPDHLEQHLPLTMITRGRKRANGKKAPRQQANLSPDRLDNNRDYTVQNIIFIRNDENVRKKDSSYEDCKIQMRLHEERFKNDLE